MTLETELRTRREGLEQEAPSPEVGSGRWSPYWDRCRACGTQEMPHRGRGLCDVCYLRLRMLGLLPPLTGYLTTAKRRNTGTWSRGQESCRACGTTERPHHARGMCARCYMRWLRAKQETSEAKSPASIPTEEEQTCLSPDPSGVERSTALKGP